MAIDCSCQTIRFEYNGTKALVIPLQRYFQADNGSEISKANNSQQIEKEAILKRNLLHCFELSYPEFPPKRINDIL